MKNPIGLPMVACLLPLIGASMDNARFRVFVVDEQTARPIASAAVRGSFTDHFLRWTNATVDTDFDADTDVRGMCAVKGRTNCGKTGFRVCLNDGYYDTPWIVVPFDANGGKPVPLLQWWKPDNQVVTVQLQRVEHPIPLFVKCVELRDYKNVFGGFDGTDSVLRFDLMKGDWLPPVGRGEVADLIMATHSNFVERAKGGAFDFDCYECSLSVVFPGEGNGVVSEIANPTAGIKIRQAPKTGYAPVVKRRFGRKRMLFGANVMPKEYADEDTNRCHGFRIRSRYDGKGNLVEAYYGKIYGDFHFFKVWRYGERQFFLYYLNPKSLDRNLEWDMKNNLCPNGNVGLRQP